MSFQENSGTLMDKYTFLNNYDNLSRTIREGQSCYAIASEWWQNFEMLLTVVRSDDDMMIPSFSPIDNTRLVILSDHYKDLIKPTKLDYNINLEKLVDLRDWDHMSIKPNLRYNDDFVILSHSLWKFLKTKFSGGPEIELIPEKKAPIYKDVTCITNSDEPYLDDNLMVSFDLMKIYWTRDENYELIKAMYISNKVKARHLLNALAKTTMINPDKACVTAKGEKVDFELTSNILTLEDYKITENQVLNITQRSSNDVGHRSNDKGNNTGKDIEMNDLNENHMKMEGSEDPNNNNNNKDKNFPEIGEFKAKLNSKAHGQHQVSLEYKQLPEIKQNLNKILLEWTSENSNAIKIEKV